MNNIPELPEGHIWIKNIEYLKDFIMLINENKLLLYYSYYSYYIENTCENCSLTIYSHYKVQDASVLLCYFKPWYTNGFNYIPTCEEVIMEEALK